MCLVCHQMSTESGGTAGIATFSVFTLLLTARSPTACGTRQCLSDLWLLQSCSASSDAPPAAAKGRIQEEEGWWGQDEDIRMHSHALSVLAPEGSCGFDAQAWPSQGPCPWSCLVLRLHEFSIPLGKQFRALIWNQIWIPDPRIPVYLANCSLESWMLWWAPPGRTGLRVLCHLTPPPLFFTWEWSCLKWS